LRADFSDGGALAEDRAPRPALLLCTLCPPLGVKEVHCHVAKTHSVSVDDHDRAGTALQTKHYLDEDDNVDLVVISDGPAMIVAVPKATGSRIRIDAGDLDCLAKCNKIDDLEKRLNCILLCPANSGWDVFVRVEQRL